MNLNLEKTKRKLSLLEKIIYYKISIILFLISFFYLIYEFSNRRIIGELELQHKTSFFLIIISLILLWKKDKNLKLETFKTTLNKIELKEEIEKLANEFNWIAIYSSENEFEFKIEASSNRNNFNIEFKRYINLIIVIHQKKFLLNPILAIENIQFFQPFDFLGESKQCQNIIVNRLKTT
jgi:tRNA G10  N-methylase Trm11